jgi:hypothetical protein
MGVCVGCGNRSDTGIVASTLPSVIATSWWEGLWLTMGYQNKLAAGMNKWGMFRNTQQHWVLCFWKDHVMENNLDPFLEVGVNENFIHLFLEQAINLLCENYLLQLLSPLDPVDPNLEF